MPISAIERGSRWLLFAGVAVLPLMHPPLRRAGHAAILADLVLVAALLLWLLALVARRAVMRTTALYRPLAAYLGCSALATIFSSDVGRSLPALAIELYLAMLFVLAFNLLAAYSDLVGFVRAWTVGTALAAIVGAAGVALFYAGIRDPELNFTISDYGSLAAGNYPRIWGTFLDSSLLANYLSVGALALLALRRTGRLGAVAFSVLLGLLMIAAAFSAAPGLGALLLGTGLWLWLEWRHVRPAMARWALAAGVAAALLFVAALLVSPSEGAAHGWRSALAHPELSPRVECWRAALQTLWAHPALGLGPAVFMPCPEWTTPYGRVLHLGEAHNTYLNIAALQGLPALAAFVWLLAALAQGIRLRVDNDRGAIAAALGIAFLVAMLYGGLATSFEHTRHLWLLMGALAAAGEAATEQRAPSPSSA